VDLDLTAYLDRIGRADLRGAPPDLSTLRALHLAHPGAIVFENLDIQRGLPVRLDLASLQAKLVGARRGGYCFEHNALLAAVLGAYGYRVTRLCGRVRLGKPAGVVPPRTHMLLRVDLDEGPHLVDVGFGGGELLQPLPLVHGRHRQHGWDYELVPHAGGHLLRARLPHDWVDLYEFTEDPAHPIDYEVANHYTATHPESGFVQTLTAQRARPDLRLVLRGRVLDEIRPDGATRRELTSRAELLALLADRFDLHFPPDTEFRDPRWRELAD
jgi:N-hydroxyarylamine O-acetyltransferase